MGHIIDYGFLKAKTEKKAMKEGLEKAKEFAYYNVDYLENPSRSYHGNFKFYNRTFNTEDEADRFFADGFYKDGVCLVKKPSDSLYKKYYDKLNKIKVKKNGYWEKELDKFQQRKSATIGCKKCGKRIHKDDVNNYRCPSCSSPLYSPTIKNRLEKFEKDIEDVKTWFYDEVSKKGKPTYWYKVEVHC